MNTLKSLYKRFQDLRSDLSTISTALVLLSKTCPDPETTGRIRGMLEELREVWVDPDTWKD